MMGEDLESLIVEFLGFRNLLSQLFLECYCCSIRRQSSAMLSKLEHTCEMWCSVCGGNSEVSKFAARAF
jgi:transcription elongation factor Elf1